MRLLIPGGDHRRADRVACHEGVGRGLNRRHPFGRQGGRRRPVHGRAHGQSFQIGHDVVQSIGVPTPPGRVVFQEQVLSHQPLAERGQENRQGRRIHEPAADGIDDVDIPLPGDLDQSGHTGCRFPPQGEGIAAVVRREPDDGLHRLQSGQFF